MRLEEADEMLRILEAQLLADQRNGECVVIQQLLCMGEQMVGNDVLGGTPHLRLHQCTKVSCGKAALFGKVSDRRKPLMQGFGPDIVIKQGDELLHHAVVNLLTGDELAVVEAQAVVEEQLNIRDDQLPRMFIDGMMQLLLYHGEDTSKHIHLLS